MLKKIFYKKYLIVLSVAVVVVALVFVGYRLLQNKPKLLISDTNSNYQQDMTNYLNEKKYSLVINNVLAQKDPNSSSNQMILAVAYSSEGNNSKSLAILKNLKESNKISYSEALYAARSASIEKQYVLAKSFYNLALSLGAKQDPTFQQDSVWINQQINALK